MVALFRVAEKEGFVIGWNVRMELVKSSSTLEKKCLSVEPVITAGTIIVADHIVQYFFWELIFISEKCLQRAWIREYESKLCLIVTSFKYPLWNFIYRCDQNSFVICKNKSTVNASVGPFQMPLLYWPASCKDTRSHVSASRKLSTNQNCCRTGSVAQLCDHEAEPQSHTSMDYINISWMKNQSDSISKILYSIT